MTKLIIAGQNAAKPRRKTNMPPTPTLNFVTGPVTVAKLLRRHPVTTPYVLVCVCVIAVLGLRPW